MDNQDRLRPTPRGLLILVGPSTVVRERLACEELGVVGRRFVGEYHHDLVPYVDALVVVPAEFGRRDSMSHENRLGVKVLGPLRLARTNKLFFQSEIDR